MSENRFSHNQYQKNIFTEAYEEFCKSIPVEVEENLKQIVASVSLLGGEHVLDVGTGTGVLIPYIRKYGSIDIVACDLTQIMLEKAREKHDGVTFWLGDVIDLPSSLGLFDVVFFNAMFGNVWNQRRILQKITNRLNPDGRICISHPLGSHFVAKLHQDNPRQTPHLLPDQPRLRFLKEGIPLEVLHYYDERDFYLLVLKRL